jgi:NAD(P)-dependent dehydrogenase (short-subunit alcohol dehydrogenase family)
MFNIKDKIIVITGATGLLGTKHAEVVAQYGGVPILLDLHKDKIDRLKEEINRKYSVGALGFVVDISDELQVKTNSNDILKLFGRIDGLINNAANNPKVEKSHDKNFSRLENFPLETWNNDVAVGLTGAFLCAKYYGHAISKNSYGGAIINISSDLGIIAPDQRLYRKPNISDNLQPVKPVTYSVIKHGIIGLTKYLATYWLDSSVRVNSLCPGGVFTNQPDDFLENLTNLIPMGRMANIDEYKGSVIFLLSDASSYMTGQNLIIDGGRTCW